MSRLSSDDWLALVEIARRAISSVILEKRLPDFPPFPAALSEPRGAFVSLYCGGILRGCVGQVENPGPLADVVARSAINAALHDSRFPPISAEEVASSGNRNFRLDRAGTHSARSDCRGPAWADGGARILQRDFCFRKSPPSENGPASGCSRKLASRRAWRAMPGAIPRREVFGFTAEVFSEKEPRIISEP